MPSMGTRVPNGRRNNRASTQGLTRGYTRDLGMKARYSGSVTITASNNRLAGPGNTQFRAYDWIMVKGGLLNNGNDLVSAVAGATIDVFPFGVKDEGPLTLEVRTI